MRLEPVRTHRKPDYPTRIELKLHPEMLEAIPRRWRSNPAALAVLAMVTSVGGCNDHGRGKGAPSSSGAVERSLAKVAPIFAHGSGRASTGGVDYATIVFMTEDEAVQVVIDEAAKAGVSFGEPSQTPLFTLPPRTPRPSASALPPKTDWLRPDGTDAQRKISFEVYSIEDFDASGEPRLNDYNFKQSAEWFRKRIQTGESPAYYGVFYDPLPGYVDPPALPPGSFDEKTRAPISLFQKGGDGRTISAGGKTLRFEVGSPTVEIDGKKRRMPTTSELRGNLLYVPLRFVVEALEGKVKAQPKSQRVEIDVPVVKRVLGSDVEVLDFGGEVGPATVAFVLWDRDIEYGPTLKISQQQLRAQVRDFIAWLRAEGVI